MGPACGLSLSLVPRAPVSRAGSFLLPDTLSPFPPASCTPGYGQPRCAMMRMGKPPS